MSEYHELMRQRESEEQKRKGKEIRLRRRALSRRPRQPHFRWRVTRLYFCIGGESVAAWPSHIETFSAPEYKTLAQRDRWRSDTEFLRRVFVENWLPTTQRDIVRLVRMLRHALLRAEGTKRAASARRQRARLDRWLAGK